MRTTRPRFVPNSCFKASSAANRICGSAGTPGPAPQRAEFHVSDADAEQRQGREQHQRHRDRLGADFLAQDQPDRMQPAPARAREGEGLLHAHIGEARGEIVPRGIRLGRFRGESAPSAGASGGDSTAGDGCEVFGMLVFNREFPGSAISQSNLKI